jgi:hypothetical protein
MNKIELIGGPLCGTILDDRGTALIRMGVASEWTGDRPKIGSMLGEAIYLPEDGRKTAFYQRTDNVGECVEIVEPDEEGEEAWKTKE